VFIKEHIGLVLVDSIASLVRKEFGGSARAMIDRSDLLAKEAVLLKRYAELFCMPVRMSWGSTSAPSP
jgi:RecA/RadA recombinase